MDDPSSLLPRARHVLELAKADPRAAERALDELSLADQVAVVCEAPLAWRARVLALTPRPEEVIPRLPEAELCFTVKAVGLDDASWMLEHASANQILACLDLDGWSGLEIDRPALERWMSVLSEAGEEPLLRAAHNLDPELLVLYLRDRVEVALKPGKDEAEDWEPPDGAQSIDGQFYIAAKRPGDDLAPLLRMLDTLFRNDYWLYFRLLQGAMWELDSELEEWALRWRTGRLEELGFPAWDEAMRIYGFIRPEKRGELAADSRPLEVLAWSLPVWVPELPAALDSRHAVFRSVAELDPEERKAFLYAFIAIANKVAVADRMPLGDAETLPASMEKTAAIASRGLEYIATDNGIGMADALQRVTLERLFRVGASLEAESQK